MAFIAARMSVLRGRPPGDASGSAVPAAPTPHPSDRSDNRCLPADRSDGPPPSTITVSPVTGNHDAAPHATGLWVRLLSPPREPHDAGRTSLREFLYPQIGRPLCRVFALAADTWPERVIAADLLHE